MFLRSLARVDSIEAVLQCYPLIRESSGLVCTSTAESKQAWCSMLRDLFSASDSAASDAALFRMYLVIKECCKRGHVHVCAYTSGLAAHPASIFASHELVALHTAHPVYCLASQINVKRWCGIFRCRNLLKAQSHHWHATGINIQLHQRQALLRRSAYCALLVTKMLCFQGECGVSHLFNFAKRIASQCNFLGSEKNQVGDMFEEGRQLYREQRYRDAAERWGQAALLQHAPSYSHLSNMLLCGRPGVPVDLKRAFLLASAGAALGCAHSKGVLGWCYSVGFGVATDCARGLALGKESAEAGSCFGQFLVGSCNMSGACNVAQDYAAALQLFRLASAQGHAESQQYLAKMFTLGQGVARDYAKAFELYRLAAAQGNAFAQYELGFMLAKGQGSAQDDAEAVRMFRLAAAQGIAHSQNYLGWMLERGQGVAHDNAEAVRFYRLAAAQGLDAAMRNLGYMLERGRGVAQDDAEAVRLYRLAAKQGNSAARCDLGNLFKRTAAHGFAESQRHLGYMYANGQGAAQDFAKAAQFYRLAAEQGDAFAQFELGNMFRSGHGVTQDFAEAMQWFRLAAAQGDPFAQNALGMLYSGAVVGHGAAQDDAEAVRMFRLAAAQEYAYAQYNLGYMFEKGQGVAQDKAEAIRLYRSAAAQGLAIAKDRLKRLINLVD